MIPPTELMYNTASAILSPFISNISKHPQQQQQHKNVAPKKLSLSRGILHPFATLSDITEIINEKAINFKDRYQEGFMEMGEELHSGLDKMEDKVLETAKEALAPEEGKAEKEEEKEDQEKEEDVEEEEDEESISKKMKHKKSSKDVTEKKDERETSKSTNKQKQHQKQQKHEHHHERKDTASTSGSEHKEKDVSKHSEQKGKQKQQQQQQHQHHESKQDQKQVSKKKSAAKSDDNETNEFVDGGYIRVETHSENAKLLPHSVSSAPSSTILDREKDQPTKIQQLEGDMKVRNIHI